VSRRAAWLCGVLALATAGGARAEAFRTLIMVDASSSMRKTDPQKLRKVAAELYVDLARDGDRIAVWQFDSEAKEILGEFLQIRSPADRDRLKDAIRSISDDGDWTDFGAAFEAAAQAFAAAPADPGEKRFLVFLTDGRCEPAPDNPKYLKEGDKPDRSKRAKEAREQQCKQTVLSELLPRLEGVETVAVGLSRNAPREFLHELARRSRGRSSVTEKAADLPRLFAEIHAQNSGARVAAAESSAIRVDKLVASLDLVVVAPRGVELELLQPDGTRLSFDSPALYYVRAERYRFFHVPKPASGLWTVKPSKRLADSAISAIQNYDLRLRLDAPQQVAVGQPIEVRAFLAAGEGGGMPEESFLARHRFVVEAKGEGFERRVELAAGEGGARVGRIATQKPGSVVLRARVEPGPAGALTRVAAPVTVLAVPPLKLVAPGPLQVGEVKPGTSVQALLDLRPSEFLGDVELKLQAEGLPFEVEPRKLKLTLEQKRFDLEIEVPEDAAPGKTKGALMLVPLTAPYENREGGRIEVEATILPLTFWEKHGGKTTFGLAVLLIGFVVAGFKLPSRFPRKLRVFYVDKPNDDEGDYGLALRAKPGFYRPASLRIGGGGPIRRSAPLLCEIVARDGGVEMRPARGRSATAGEVIHTRPFTPVYGTKYELDEGLVIWIGKEDEDE
jgi:Mg-chelatase subunit ChlD